MPCFLVIDGKKQEMDEGIFDQVVEALLQKQPKNHQSKHPPDGNLMELMTANH